MTANWGEITLQELIDPIKGELISGDGYMTLKGLSTDSREIDRGEIFLALRGDNFDGHDFVSAAIEKGASCIIVDNLENIPPDSDVAVVKVRDSLGALGDIANYWRSGHRVTVASITGSMGKTTVKEMAANILELGEKTLKNSGNLNNLVGLPLTLLRLNSSYRKVVLEMGMNRPGEIGRLTQISDPDIGLINNVGPVHLEGVKDINGVARAKTEMIKEIRPDSEVILFGDDNLLMKEASRFKRNFFTFGLRPGNDLTAEDIEADKDGGTSFVMRYGKSAIPVSLRIPGLHNLINSLAAASIAVCMKEKFENIAIGLNGFRGVKGRLIPVELPDDIILLDDTYNANPPSLSAALAVAKELAGRKRRIIVGLGEMLELGNETIPAHIEAGEMVAESGACFFFAFGAHAQHMLKGAIDRSFPSEKTMEVFSHRDMVQEISNVMEKGDLILLKGSRMMGLENVVSGLRRSRQKEEHDVEKIEGNYGCG